MTEPFVFPNVDPVIFQIGPLAIRWYALAYIVGLVGAWRYGIWLANHSRPRFMNYWEFTQIRFPVTPAQVSIEKTKISMPWQMKCEVT